MIDGWNTMDHRRWQEFTKDKKSTLSTSELDRYLPTIYYPSRQLSASRWKRLLQVADIQTQNCGTSQDIEHSLTRTSLASLAPKQRSDRHNEQTLFEPADGWKLLRFSVMCDVSAVWDQTQICVEIYSDAFVFSSWIFLNELDATNWRILSGRKSAKVAP